MEAPKEISKRAAEKARKKAEKAAKKAELATRPKPAAEKKDVSVFETSWLKETFEATPQRPVRTRFPPEPNGFLHIGHAKAITVNFGFAKHHDGICFLRYDDTNPAKEEGQYFDSIKNSIEWLGFKPYEITYSSDHFDKLYELAEELIKRDKAYTCHCSREDINMQRGGPDKGGERFACPHRSRPTEESLAEFHAMRDGKYKAGEAHLRMKQDIQSPNPQMWDLGAYRVVEKNHHHRTGDKWVVYPTYDFTHCLCDAFEGITHSMCTSEFRLSRESYDWLLQQLDMKVPNSEEKGPMQREYGRLNLTGTILSKRRIQMLVSGTTVEKPDGTTKVIPPTCRGWDDPRLYTLVAIRRRGIPAQSLIDFVTNLGVTDTMSYAEISKFEWMVRKTLERTVPRLMLVLDPIKVIIEDLPDDFNEELRVPFDPKNPEGDSRMVRLTKTVYIDRSDWKSEHSDEFFRLTPAQPVGLLSAPFPIKATSFTTDPTTGLVTEIRAAKAVGPKPRAFIQWVSDTSLQVTARVYRPLFKSNEPNSLDWKNGGWADDLNPDSESEFLECRVEKALEGLIKKHPKDLHPSSDDFVRFQGMRTAYFVVDTKDTTDDKIVLNQIVTLKEDSGKTK